MCGIVPMPWFNNSVTVLGPQASGRHIGDKKQYALLPLAQQLPATAISCRPTPAWIRDILTRTISPSGSYLSVGSSDFHHGPRIMRLYSERMFFSGSTSPQCQPSAANLLAGHPLGDVAPMLQPASNQSAPRPSNMGFWFAFRRAWRACRSAMLTARDPHAITRSSRNMGGGLVRGSEKGRDQTVCSPVFHLLPAVVRVGILECNECTGG
jgi:hypothetical protein